MPTERELQEARLPAGFQFSQGSLQDFVDCRRRFQLRYLWNLSWPAVESEPALEHETFMRQGAAFHHIVQQHLLGVPAEVITGSLRGGDEILAGWWGNYLEHAGFVQADDLEGRYVEIALTAPLGDYRLVAKFDLLLLHAGGRGTIVDWKTSRRPPRRAWLAERLQTRVYPYLLVRAGAALNGGQPLTPEQVEMLYWYTNAPTQPMRFEYSQAQYQADETYLVGLVESIQGLEGQAFYLTADERRCRFCVYRSLCNRGVEAGEGLSELEGWEDEDLQEAADLAAATFDFEQIGEIEF
jgi:hypothetical protein